VWGDESKAVGASVGCRRLCSFRMPGVPARLEIVPGVCRLLTIFNKPELEAIFTNRHVSAADIHAQKEAFRISEIRNVIESFDPQLAKIFNELYQRSIDFGGHPNPCGTFSAMKIENSGPPILSMTAFMTDPPILQHARRALHRSVLRACGKRLPNPHLRYRVVRLGFATDSVSIDSRAQCARRCD
jgi:hypothetical protein